MEAVDIAVKAAISIHAPAKGATLGHEVYLLYGMISIHAPAKGATYTHYFVECTDDISIHAPAKGATYKKRLKMLKKLRFQSTHPRRVRLWSGRPRRQIGNDFNPRTREGCDAQGFDENGKEIISIHAPAKGATVVTVTNSNLGEHFNPRTREGCDCCLGHLR